MPAIFVWVDGHEERATVELDAHALPPYTAEHRGGVFQLEHVSKPGVAVYVQRRRTD